MIYIIEDDQYARDGFKMLLKSVGFESSCFESAEDFLKCYKAGANDLILLDMNLSGMNGNSLLEYLQKRGMQIPAIIVTAYDEQSSRNAAKNYGALAYLRKPVDSEALIDLIRFNIQPNISSTLSTNNI